MPAYDSFDERYTALPPQDSMGDAMNDSGYSDYEIDTYPSTELTADGGLDTMAEGPELLPDENNADGEPAEDSAGQAAEGQDRSEVDTASLADVPKQPTAAADKTQRGPETQPTVDKLETKPEPASASPHHTSHVGASAIDGAGRFPQSPVDQTISDGPHPENPAIGPEQALPRAAVESTPPDRQQAEIVDHQHGVQARALGEASLHDARSANDITRQMERPVAQSGGTDRPPEGDSGVEDNNSRQRQEGAPEAPAAGGSGQGGGGDRPHQSGDIEPGDGGDGKEPEEEGEASTPADADTRSKPEVDDRVMEYGEIVDRAILAGKGSTMVTAVLPEGTLLGLSGGYIYRARHSGSHIFGDGVDPRDPVQARMPVWAAHREKMGNAIESIAFLPLSEGYYGVTYRFDAGYANDRTTKGVKEKYLTFAGDPASLTVWAKLPSTIAIQLQNAMGLKEGREQRAEGGAGWPVVARLFAERLILENGGMDRDYWNHPHRPVRPPYEQLPRSWTIDVITYNPTSPEQYKITRLPLSRSSAVSDPAILFEKESPLRGNRVEIERLVSPNLGVGLTVQLPEEILLTLELARAVENEQVIVNFRRFQTWLKTKGYGRMHLFTDDGGYSHPIISSGLGEAAIRSIPLISHPGGQFDVAIPGKSDDSEVLAHGLGDMILVKIRDLPGLVAGEIQMFETVGDRKSYLQAVADTLDWIIKAAPLVEPPEPPPKARPKWRDSIRGRLPKGKIVEVVPGETEPIPNVWPL